METPIGDDEDSHLGDFIEEPRWLPRSTGYDGVAAANHPLGAGTAHTARAKVLRMRFGIDMNTDTLRKSASSSMSRASASSDRGQGAAQAAPPEPQRAVAQLPDG